MKTLGPFVNDGFRESIAMPRFIREMQTDTAKALTSLIGAATAFISGGAITSSMGSTTITDGILYKDGKLYTFIGGTYVGAASDLMILFSETTHPDFPKATFENDPIPKDVYNYRVCRIDVAGTVVLSSVTSIKTLQVIKSDISTINSDIAPLLPNANITVPVSAGATGTITVRRRGNVVDVQGFYQHAGATTTSYLKIADDIEIPILPASPYAYNGYINGYCYLSQNVTTLLLNNYSTKPMQLAFVNGKLKVNLLAPIAAGYYVHFKETFII